MDPSFQANACTPAPTAWFKRSDVAAAASSEASMARLLRKSDRHLAVAPRNLQAQNRHGHVRCYCGLCHRAPLLPLLNSAKDARDMAAELRTSGFEGPETRVLTNANRRRMDGSAGIGAGELVRLLLRGGAWCVGIRGLRPAAREGGVSWSTAQSLALAGNCLTFSRNLRHRRISPPTPLPSPR